MSAKATKRVFDAGVFFRRLAALVALWWALDEGRANGWWFAPFIIAGALVIHRALPASESRWRWSLVGLLRFLPYFIAKSIRGGWDVSRRAFCRTLPLDPLMIDYTTRLRNPTARLFFTHVISLLPGTLSADARGDVIRVHALTGPESEVRAATAELEALVAALFGESLAPEGRS
jgi:multicomponent Na+:H+ antiporter subunit E